jgi:hypothetical protein
VANKTTSCRHCVELDHGRKDDSMGFVRLYLIITGTTTATSYGSSTRAGGSGLPLQLLAHLAA